MESIFTNFFLGICVTGLCCVMTVPFYFAMDQIAQILTLLFNWMRQIRFFAPFVLVTCAMLLSYSIVASNM